MIHPFQKKFLEALNKCIINNGDGTSTLESVARGASSTTAGTAGYVRPSILNEVASKLFTDDGDGTFRLNIK